MNLVTLNIPSVVVVAKKHITACKAELWPVNDYHRAWMFGGVGRNCMNEGTTCLAVMEYTGGDLFNNPWWERIQE